MSLPLHIDKEFKFDFEYYRKKYLWIDDMFLTEQDNIHHFEGNVGRHVELVLNSLIRMSEFKKISQEDKKILFIGALFHDVEKRSTTQLDNGRIVSPGHAKKGEKTTRSILYRDFATDFYTREKICKIVRHHGLPLWIFEKENPQKSIIESSLVSNNFHLSLIAIADVNGRYCPDKEELLYRIDLFKEYSKENNCYGENKKFVDAHSRVVFFEKQESYPEYEAFNDTKFKAIMMCGLQGSGKDTWIENNFDLPVISLDILRRENKIDPDDKYATGFIIQMAKEKSREFMRKNQSFIWNATNLTKQIRQQLLGLWREYGAWTRIVYLEVPYEQLRFQNKNREYPIPEQILERFIDKIEIPSLSEAHEVDYIISKTPTIL